MAAMALGTRSRRFWLFGSAGLLAMLFLFGLHRLRDQSLRGQSSGQPALSDVLDSIVSPFRQSADNSSDGHENDEKDEKEKPPANRNLLDDPRIAAASNETLGFHKILWINLKQRFDKQDANRIATLVSGLQTETYLAVDGKKDVDDVGRIGLAPMNGRNLKGGELACLRSHANIWSEMVETKSPPILIMESDAHWDVNLRAIMALANARFVEYLAEIGSKPDQKSTGGAPTDAGASVNDPWMSDHWDLLTLGHCADSKGWYKSEEHPDKVYVDKWAGSSGDRFTLPEGGTRYIRRTTGFPCTTAYAVSYRGAARMLHRHALGIDNPVDLIMMTMINAKELVAYSISPPPVTQWEYTPHLGPQAKGSDIHDAEDADEDRSGWDSVWETHDVWSGSEKVGGLKFKKPALSVAYGLLHRKEGWSEFTMPEVRG